MGFGRDRRPAGSTDGVTPRGGTPGKTTLVEATFGVQMRRAAQEGDDAGAVQAAAAQGISGSATSLPHLDTIQRAFGSHDVSGIQAHTDASASAGSRAMGAEAYATGDHVAFDGAPSLHTAAHEAAHVVQQRAGVHLKGGVGESGDRYERHADAVADRVVAGDSAQDLLDQHAPGGDATGVQDKDIQRQAVQRQVPPPAPPAANPGGAAGPLDRLRAAILALNAAEVRSAYGALQAADKVVVARDAHLLTDMVRLLDPSVALAILGELALPRPTLLQVTAGGKPGDAVFLGEVLGLAGLNHLTALAASAGDLRPFPAFLTTAVIDPIVNAGSATAMAQLQLASASGGQILLQAVYPGQIPTEFLTKLHSDLGVVRGGFQTSAAFRRWMLTKPAVLGRAIVSTSDGFAWARLVWSSSDAAVLTGWINAYTAYWGQALGDGLLTGGTAADGTALRGHPGVASAVFGSIARVHAAAGLAQVFAKLHLPLAEQVKALQAARLLDAASLHFVLNGTGVSVTDQAALTHDDAVIAMIQPLVAGQRADQVLAILAGNQVAFCRAVSAKSSFTTWVTHDQAQLTATMNALPSWGAWIAAFRTMNAWDLVLRLAADATLKANLRAGIIAKTAWSWLVRSVPHPVSTQPHAAALLDLYGDGSGITLPDKHLTWTALYRTPLSRAGHDHVYTWRGGFLNSTKYEKRYIAVDPNDDAMNLFFHSFRQLPRAHIDTASGVVMSNFYRIKSDPLVGSKQLWDDRSGWTQMAAPGQIPIGTSYYMGDNWIVMRATATAGAVGAGGSVGTPDTGRIGSWSGSGTAVNTPGKDPLSPVTPANMTMFQNHATHEVGHAVGARKLRHGTYNIAGDDWAKTYGNWAQNGTANGYATMCGWTAAMDTTNYSLRDATATRRITLAGVQIKAFLTGIIGGGTASQAGHTLATTFGSVDAALNLLSVHATLGGHLLVQNVVQLSAVSTLPDQSYIIPAGIDPGAAKVHFFCTRWDNKWVSYDAVCWRNKVSHYGVSSYKEMFAEMYTAKFSGAALSPPNNGMTPADFFNALQQADPTELGLPAYGGSPATPGPSQPGQGQAAGDGQVQTAAAEPQPPEQAHNPGDNMPAAARGIPR
jgi:hypothetical protein